MKLDHECVRSILLTIEEKHQYGKVLRLEEILQSERLYDFDEDEIKYVLIKLADAEYIEGTPQYGSNELIYFDCNGLTWSGHQFLDTIRDPEVWKKTKRIASKLTSVSITMLSSIGSQVLAKLLGI